MSLRFGPGWQTILADLALILFMVAASALPDARSSMPLAAEQAARPSELAQPLAVWRAASGAPSLQQWLAEQPADSRQQLTIRAYYLKGEEAAAAARAVELARQAGKAGALGRIVIEPGNGESTAELSFDGPQTGMAWALHDGLASPDHTGKVP
ncbi:MAG: hypothetical protein N2423_02785 [Novosphingobium sp.]|nr:hypothetical protein [Novosphingobium sp.]